MDTAHVIQLLEPQGSWTAPSPLQYERGVTSASSRVHALKKTLDGNRAMCDASLEIIRLGGRFNPDELNSCLACGIATRH